MICILVVSIFCLVTIKSFALPNPSQCDQFPAAGSARPWHKSTALLRLEKGNVFHPKSSSELADLTTRSPNMETLTYLGNLKKNYFTGFPCWLDYLFYVTVYAIWYLFSGLQLHCQVTISCKSLTLWHKLVCNNSISINNSESMFCIDIN